MKVVLLCLCYGVLVGILILSWIEIGISIKHLRCINGKKKDTKGKMEFPFVSKKKYDEVVYKLECLLCHATGGRYSKATYSLNDMCKMVTDYIDRCIEDSEGTE